MTCPTWYETIETVDEQEIYNAVATFCVAGIPESISDVIEILRAEEIEGTSDAELSWQILVVLENPKTYMKMFIDILKKNMTAYEEVIQSIRAKVSPLISAFELNSELYLNQELAELTPLLENAGIEEITLQATLAGAASFIMANGGILIAGLCYHEIYVFLDRREQPVENSIPAFKVLGDTSKFEILRFLKVAPNNNAEIAKHMGLTPATVSHHMNVLFALSLVKIDSNNKKVYYSVNEEQIKKLINDLEIAFL
jgi:DNA-binding transcriptional ArsR family regulator